MVERILNMSEVDIVLQICGMAGEGTISAGEILARCMSDQGFSIMSYDSYPAEIRGFGKCVAHLRVGEREILSAGKFADILVSLNDEHSITQLPSLKENGVVIYDNKPRGFVEEDRSIAGWIEPGMTSYGVPLLELSHKASGDSRGRNMVALGAVAALFDIDVEAFKKTILARYAKKKQAVIDANLNSFLAGSSWTKANVFKTDGLRFGKGRKAKKSKLIVSGNEVAARAALDSGIHLYAGYPITPATKIMEILSKELPKRGGVMIQTEDEISAAGHVIGAGFAGRRAMTATSGPGFCLMTELINLAVMAEVPAVIINSQRGGPSTGLPTKTEQSDLSLALSGAGDSPRIVIAPTSVEDCYDCVSLAFYYAEKYQTAVVVLMDFFLSNSIKNIEAPKPPAAKLLNANVGPSKSEMKDYMRYKMTETGVSPRTLPGTPGGMFTATGLEHTERGKPSYSPKVHSEMTEKRHLKLRTLLKEAPAPVWYGDKKNVNVGVLTWGSTIGAAREAVDKARALGIRAAVLKTVMMNPLQTDEIAEFVGACEILLAPESNYGGQFATLLGGRLPGRIVRAGQVTGLPYPAEDILEKIVELAG